MSMNKTERAFQDLQDRALKAGMSVGLYLMPNEVKIDLFAHGVEQITANNAPLREQIEVVGDRLADYKA